MIENECWRVILSSDRCGIRRHSEATPNLTFLLNDTEFDAVSGDLAQNEHIARLKYRQIFKFSAWKIPFHRTGMKLHVNKQRAVLTPSVCSHATSSWCIVQ